MPRTVLLCCGVALGALACAHAPPDERLKARAAYGQASTGVAAEQAPAQLRTAHAALERAERSARPLGEFALL